MGGLTASVEWKGEGLGATFGGPALPGRAGNVVDLLLERTGSDAPLEIEVDWSRGRTRRGIVLQLPFLAARAAEVRALVTEIREGLAGPAPFTGHHSRIRRPEGGSV